MLERQPQSLGAPQRICQLKAIRAGGRGCAFRAITRQALPAQLSPIDPGFRRSRSAARELDLLLHHQLAALLRAQIERLHGRDLSRFMPRRLQVAEDLRALED